MSNRTFIRTGGACKVEAIAGDRTIQKGEELQVPARLCSGFFDAEGWEPKAEWPELTKHREERAAEAAAKAGTAAPQANDSAAGAAGAAAAAPKKSAPKGK